MIDYFADVATLDDLKREYRRLAMQLHPDCGGSTAAMQELNRQYESAMQSIRFAAPADSRDASTTETAAEFVRIVDLLLRLHLSVELCGRWLWITGDTRPVKDDLKAAGCRWSAKKSAWYWHPSDAAPRRHRGTASMDAIRTRYGSVKLSGGDAVATV